MIFISESRPIRILSFTVLIGFLSFFIPPVFAYDPSITIEAVQTPDFYTSGINSRTVLVSLDQLQLSDPENADEMTGLELEALDNIYQPPEFQTTAEGTEFTWNHGGFLKYITAGFYFSPAEVTSENSESYRQFKTWSGAEGVRFQENADPEELKKQDFSFNASTTLSLNPKTEIQLDQYGSETSILMTSGVATYGFAGFSNWISRRINDFVKASIGFELISEKYKEDSYKQTDTSYAPMFEVEFTPFKNNKLLKNISLKTFGETRMFQYGDDYTATILSRSRTAGFVLKWVYKGFEVSPGIAFRHEVEDLSDPDPADITSRYVNVSKQLQIGKLKFKPFAILGLDSRDRQDLDGEKSNRLSAGMEIELTKNLSLTPSYSRRQGKSFTHEVAPKSMELGADLRYKLRALQNKTFLIHCGYDDPLDSGTQRQDPRSKAAINSAFVWEF